MRPRQLQLEVRFTEGIAGVRLWIGRLGFQPDGKKICYYPAGCVSLSHLNKLGSLTYPFIKRMKTPIMFQG